MILWEGWLSIYANIFSISFPSIVQKLAASSNRMIWIVIIKIIAKNFYSFPLKYAVLLFFSIC